MGRGRPKVFCKSNLPSGVVGICVAIISDYNRRDKEIKRGSINESLLLSYKKYNNIVDVAARHIEQDNKAEFISDIESGRGYRYSLLNREYTSPSYYSRKRDFIYEVAVGLELVEKNE